MINKENLKSNLFPESGVVYGSIHKLKKIVEFLNSTKEMVGVATPLEPNGVAWNLNSYWFVQTQSSKITYDIDVILSLIINIKTNNSFIEGRWYKGRMDDKYIKFLRLTNEGHFNKVYYSEKIENGKYIKTVDYWASNSLESFALKNPVDLKEIQKYLPDCHPDKILPNNNLSVGDWVISNDKKYFGKIHTKNSGSLLIKELMNIGESKKVNKKFFSDYDFRKAELNEIPHQDLSMEDILDICKKTYTEGVYFKSIISDEGLNRIVKGYFIDEITDKHYVINNGKEIYVSKGFKCEGLLCSNPTLYKRDIGFCPLVPSPYFYEPSITDDNKLVNADDIIIPVIKKERKNLDFTINSSTLASVNIPIEKKETKKIKPFIVSKTNLII